MHEVDGSRAPRVDLPYEMESRQGDGENGIQGIYQNRHRLMQGQGRLVL